MLVLKGLVLLHRTVQLQLLQCNVTGWGIDVDYCDIEWFALETDRDHSVIFAIASKYCISNSLERETLFSLGQIMLRQETERALSAEYNQPKVIFLWNITSLKLNGSMKTYNTF